MAVRDHTYIHTYIYLVKQVNNYLITESEVVTEKSQTEALPY